MSMGHTGAHSVTKLPASGDDGLSVIGGCTFWIVIGNMDACLVVFSE